MKKYEGKSIRKGATHTGNLPNNVGFDGRGGGYIRPLAVKEIEAKKRLGVFVIVNNKPFYGHLH